MPGRHCAPVARPRLAGVATRVALTTGAVTTGAISFPIVAQAAPTGTWDEVARCESTNNWSINTGNGFSGGLQFTPSTWRAFGGTQYAPAAYLASRAEQIIVAERVLAGQGRGAWPVCGRNLGGSAANRGATGASTGTPAASSASATSRSDAASSAPSSTSRATSTRVSGSGAPAHVDVSDQPRDVQRAVAASGPTNPACVSLKHRGVAESQMETLHRAHRELGLDGNGNGVPCEVTFPRHAAAGASAPQRASAAARTPGTSSPQRSTTATPSASSSGIVATAQQWIGTPYRYGGNSRAGVDCSGLVQQVFRANGVNLPRTAAAQMSSAHRITRAQARPGDLVGNPQGSHIGIYAGNGLMIDSPHTGSYVGLRRLYPDSTVFGRIG